MEISLQERRGVSYFACDGFDPAVAAHGFSTRLGGVSPAPWDSLNLGANRGDGPENVAENFRRFCHAVGTDAGALVKNHQVHGKLVRPVTAGERQPNPGAPGECQADGLITDQPGVCLTIFSADCIPVLLLDPVRRVAAAVHAGWRGAALGIAAQAARQMQEDYGCRAQDIQAAIGPGISPCCFLTHDDVPDALRQELGELARPYIVPAADGRYQVDLKGVNAHWLQQAGLLNEQIAACSVCTACHPELFWSHRVLGERRGSMAAMIQLL